MKYIDYYNKRKELERQLEELKYETVEFNYLVSDEECKRIAFEIAKDYDSVRRANIAFEINECFTKENDRISLDEKTKKLIKNNILRNSYIAKDTEEKSIDIANKFCNEVRLSCGQIRKQLNGYNNEKIKSEWFILEWMEDTDEDSSHICDIIKETENYEDILNTITKYFNSFNEDFYNKRIKDLNVDTYVEVLVSETANIIDDIISYMNS